MDLLSALTLIGFSHRTAPVALREKHAVRAEELPALLAELGSIEDIAEVCVFSTCNRTEVLAVAVEGERAVQAVRQRVFAALPDEHLYVFAGTHAVIHLFRVAAGLDSLVLGETEVLGQVKRSFEEARRAGTVGEHLQPLLTHALRVGKRVRSETDLGQGTLSVARVGVDVARHVFGELAGRRALVVGAGDTGVLVARHLREAGVTAIDFANRTLERAREAAAEFGGRAFALDDLARALRETDLVLAALEGAQRAIEPAHFDVRALSRRDGPLVVIDLSVPRAVADEVSQLHGVLKFDVDDLEPVVARNQKTRSDAGETSGEILVSEVHKFLALRTYASFSPAITALRQRFEEVREEVVDRVAGERADPREVQLAHELTRTLLDVALEQMKEGARRTRSEEALESEYKRFLKNL